MQINKISSTNFGAMPDLDTRHILKRASLKGIQTEDVEDLMSSIYADKYIMTSMNTSGVATIGLYDKVDGYATKLKTLYQYDRKDTSLKTVIANLADSLADLAMSRSKEQRIIDRLENKFGRYDDPSDYKHKDYYTSSNPFSN